MTPTRLAAVELEYGHQPIVRELIAAVRERDEQIAKLREALDTARRDMLHAGMRHSAAWAEAALAAPEGGRDG